MLQAMALLDSVTIATKKLKEAEAKSAHVDQAYSRELRQTMPEER